MQRETLSFLSRARSLYPSPSGWTRVVSVNELAKALLGIGLVFIVAGSLLLLATRFGIPLGRLPGDLSYRGRNFAVFFPLGTSILVSVLLSLILYILSRFRH
jgi:hypothetical protein